MQVSEVPREVKFYNHRGRLIHLLEPGTQEREDAENVARLRGEGVTFREIWEHTGISLSTLHRMMARLELTLEVESGKRDREIRRIAREAGIRMPSQRVGGGVPARATARLAHAS